MDDSRLPERRHGGLPVAPTWRPTLEAIVAAFVAGDWGLWTAPANAKRVPARLALDSQESVADYGDFTLVPLGANL